MADTWLSTELVARLASVTDRAVRKAAWLVQAKAVDGWRGAAIDVRVARGRAGGGKSGVRYEIRFGSLPLELQYRWRELAGPFETALKLDDGTAVESQWRFALIRPALAVPKQTAERAAIVREIAGREHVHPKGRRLRVGERTLQRWIEAFEGNAKDGKQAGFAGLIRKRREGHGEAVVVVTRAWDRAVVLDETVKHRIAHELRQYVRGLQKGGESLSFIKPMAAQMLEELTRAAGFDGGDTVLAGICAVPYHFIRAERAFRKVHTFKTDRSTYEDAKPRIQRSRAGLAPNDIWVCDVHPVDVLYRRADGSTATLRAIAWLDLATNRIFTTFVALEKGQGSIRNADVIRSFAMVVAAWGAPRALYLDNGSEYNWADFIGDALKLLDAQGRRLTSEIAPWAERRSNVVRAMPYNAPAKPIENIFGVLERKHFSAIPGWIGGDRLRKRTENHGREPTSFPGTAEQLGALLDSAVATYNAMPQIGRALDNRSPNDALCIAIDRGWAPISVNPDAFRIAFSSEVVRQVRQGCISHRGQWTSRELQAYQGDTVTLLVPKYEDWTRLPVRDEDGRLFTFVERDAAFGIFDPAGAVESQARSRAHARGVAQLDRSAPDINVLVERRKLAAQLPAAPALPAPAARLSPSNEANVIQEGIGLSPDAATDAARRKRSQRDKAEAEALARQAKNSERLARIKANSAKRNAEASR